MSDAPEITFHRNTFFEIQADGRTLFIDPVFTRRRRGRKVAEELRACDYLLATSMTPWFDDALDVLDECDATLVASPQLTRVASRELGLKKGRTLDLEAWERASEDGMRLTAFPMSGSIGMEGAIEEGTSVLRDMGNVFPVGNRGLSLGGIPFLSSGLGLIDDGMRNVTRALDGVAIVQQPRSLGRVGDLLGVDVGRITGGRPGLAFLFEFDGYPSVLHLADGVHAGMDEEDLEDIAEVAAPQVLIAHVSGGDLEPLVRAVRILEPATVLLYRSRDPYAAGRRSRTLPMSSFIGALEEDAPDTEVFHLRQGDSYVLAPAADEAEAPAAKA